VTDQVSIAVEGIVLRANVGATVAERAVGQTLTVDVRLVPAACPATETDDLAGTVDYGHVVAIVRELGEGARNHLIERLAVVICDRLWDELPLHQLAVTVRKPSPPVETPVGAAWVTVERTG
jgi:dihydroneopterin aldolase